MANTTYTVFYFVTNGIHLGNPEPETFATLALAESARSNFYADNPDAHGAEIVEVA